MMQLSLDWSDTMANRLAKATSRYLLQHRDNPVDWYPWGEEAFAEAKRRDAPIFLSVGYSACYWCHVIGGPLKVGTAGLKSYDLGAKRRLVAHRSALFRSVCNA
jgi:hypothetical protein